MIANSIDIGNLIEYQKKNYSYVDGVWLFDLSVNSSFPFGRQCSICKKWFKMEHIRNDKTAKFGKSSVCINCSGDYRLDNITDIVIENKSSYDSDLGLVYFISDGYKVKIGITSNLNTLIIRFRNLQINHSTKLELLGVVLNNQYTKIEKQLHKRFLKQKSHAEWFYLDDMIINFIDENTTKIILINKMLD